jgi:hypothetical protein
MSNTHEYVVFDRAELDPAFAMTWRTFEKTHPEWFQWESARDFLIEYGLGESQIGQVDEILARKTVRTTMLFTDDPFHFLWAILNEKQLLSCGIEIEKGDHDYGHKIVACADAAFLRGDLSLASLTAVCALHASCVDFSELLLPEVATAIERQPPPTPMFPGFPDFMPWGGDGLGVTQTRRVIDFLILAWKQRWPLHMKAQPRRNTQTIRSCEVAGRLVQSFNKRRLVRPCMFRWYEC